MYHDNQGYRWLFLSVRHHIWRYVPSELLNLSGSENGSPFGLPSYITACCRATTYILISSYFDYYANSYLKEAVYYCNVSCRPPISKLDLISGRKQLAWILTIATAGIIDYTLGIKYELKREIRKIMSRRLLKVEIWRIAWEQSSASRLSIFGPISHFNFLPIEINPGSRIQNSGSLIFVAMSKIEQPRKLRRESAHGTAANRIIRYA